MIEGLSTRVADETPSGIDSIDQWAKRLNGVPPFGKGSSTSPHSDERSNESNYIDLEGFSPKTASAIANVHNGKTKPGRYGSGSSRAPANGTGYNSYDTLPFIATPDLGHLSALDVRFMQLNGCFELPPMPILNELVRMYFLHTHPLVPLLDEGDFWDSFSCSNGEKIPLLLFQAMVFAACAVSPESHYPSYHVNAVVSNKNTQLVYSRSCCRSSRLPLPEGGRRGLLQEDQGLKPIPSNIIAMKTAKIAKLILYTDPIRL